VQDVNAWLLLLLFFCLFFFFPNQPTNKRKNQNPKQTTSLEISVDELSQSQEALSRHNPCSEGVSPPPLLEKVNKTEQ
jgi:hypothetical protein